MNYGVIIFYGSDAELKKVNKLVQYGLGDGIKEISNFKEYDVDGIDAMYYTIEFEQNGWLNILELQKEFNSQKCLIDIIHVLTDKATYIEVISTDSRYDSFADLNTKNSMVNLAEHYDIAIPGLTADDEEDLFEEIDEEYDLEDYDDFE